MRPLQAIADERNASEKKRDLNELNINEYEQLKQSFVDRERNKCWSETKKRDLITQYSVAVCLWKKGYWIIIFVCFVFCLSGSLLHGIFSLFHIYLPVSISISFVCNPRCWKSSIPRFSSHFRTENLFIKETL